MSPSSVDAVIIGAGHNGLVAANLLADHGWDVVICEATARVGGAVASAGLTVPGLKSDVFNSDMFSAFYPLAAASPVLKSLDLGEYGLRWTHAPAVLAHVFPDDRCAVLARDVAETAASVNEFAPGDGAAWRALSAQWDQIVDPLLDTLFSPLPALRPAQRLLRNLGLGEALRLARLAVLPVRRFGEEKFAGSGARMLLAGNALHSDLAPEVAGSALFGWLLSMLGQSHGFPVPVGGAGQLTEALRVRLLSRGGSIRVNAAVESVTISGAQARGVRLVTGETLLARRAVLADVTAPILFGQLVDQAQLPPAFLRDLANFEWDLPTLKLDWALSEPIPWTAAGASGAGTVHLGVDLDGLSRYAASLAQRKIPTEPFLLLGQMTTSDRTRSPLGTESAWAYTHLPRGVDLTEETLSHLVSRIEATVERNAPGFSDLVLARQVQSPAQLERQNPSLVGGTVMGGTSQLHQQLVFRPVPGLGGASTPIDRLYLAGSSAHPGGGVHGGPGANAARAAIARSGVTGRVRRAGTEQLLTRIYR